MQKENLTQINAAPAYLDQAFWQLFREAKTPEDFAGCWLDLQVSMINNVQGAVVVLTKDNQSYKPAKWWPEKNQSDSGLTAVAELAVKERRGIINDVSQNNSDDNSSYLLRKIPIHG